MALLVANILWLPDIDPTAALCERLGVESTAVASATLIKRSVDGRRRPPRWLANYQVHLTAGLEAETRL